MSKKTLEDILPEDHGTLHGYNYLKCRCTACRAFNSDRAARGRTARLSKEKPDRIHGTPGGYSNWGCHCTECSTAWNASCNTYYHSRAA